MPSELQYSQQGLRFYFVFKVRVQIRLKGKKNIYCNFAQMYMHVLLLNILCIDQV